MEVDPVEVDLEAEVVLDSQGRRIDQEYVDRLVDAAYETIDAHPEKFPPRVGRPPLAGRAGEGRSPQVSFRAPAELVAAAQERAGREGKPLSQVAREALQAWVS
jgi:hypothetical protein